MSLTGKTFVYKSGYRTIEFIIVVLKTVSHEKVQSDDLAGNYEIVEKAKDPHCIRLLLRRSYYVNQKLVTVYVAVWNVTAIWKAIIRRIRISF